MMYGSNVAPMITVNEVAGVLERHYPPATALDWDVAGLTVGDRSARVTKILYTVDVVDAVVDQAKELGADLIIAHHPLLLRGITTVDHDHPKGRIVAELIKSEINLYVAHTNADVPEHGVVDSLAKAVGLQHARPMVASPAEPLDKIITFVPEDQTDAVIDALAAAGAGAIGNYDRCAFTQSGVGTFRPLPGSNPYLGSENEIEQVPETRVEMVLARHHRAAVITALHAAHPYETPAFDVFELASIPGRTGLGRIGQLVAPLTLRTFAEQVAAAIPETAGGIRVAGDPDRMVSRIAVQAGAGDDLLDQARALEADVYITSDLRHHPASEAVAHTAAPALIDIPHWAAEWTWLPVVQGLVTDAVGSIPWEISMINTDPWTFRA